MTGFLGLAVMDGWLQLDRDQYEEARTWHRQAMIANMATERVLVHLARELDEHAVRYRLIKGAALSHVVYPEPSYRTFGDLDLLIHPEDFERSVATLVEAGGALVTPEVRPGFTARFGKGRTIQVPVGVEVDLHRTYTVGPIGLLADTADVFDASLPVDIGGWSVSAPTLEDAFLQSCITATVADFPPNLRYLRDVAQAALRPDLDLDLLLDRAARWHAESVVRAAVLVAFDTLKVSATSAVHSWARTVRPPLSSRLAFGSYRLPGEATTAELIGVGYVRGWANRADYLSGLLFPDESYLASMGRNRLGHLGTAFRRLIGRESP